MKRFKSLVVVMLVLVLLGVVVGCGSNQLSESFDRAKVEEKAKQVIELLNAGDYAQVTQMVREDLRPQLSEAVIEGGVTQTYGNAGSFKEYVSISIVGKKADGIDMAIAVVQGKYDSKKVTFTLVFDQQLALTGLFMK